MNRTLINTICLGAVALGSAYLTTDAHAGTEKYDACMSWCMIDYEFDHCHGTCGKYLDAEGPAPEEPVAN